MDIEEIDWDIVDWIHLIQVRDQGRALLDTNEASGTIKGRIFLE
jgi:hypothetical protein